MPVYKVTETAFQPLDQTGCPASSILAGAHCLTQMVTQ